MQDTRPVLLTSPILGRLGIPHAFTTRRGGVSSGWFDALNFGNPGELPADKRDPLANIEENFRLTLGVIGASERELVQVHQVHGAAVHVVPRGAPAHTGTNDTKADAIVTDDATRVLAIRVADCTPVLVSSRDGRVVAAVHAGWRGVVGGVVPNALREMAGRGSSRVVAAIGPCIGAEQFEVGPEVAAEFARVFGTGTAHVRRGKGDRWLVDLKGAIVEQLIAGGLAREDVDVLPHCTVGEPELFFSHRRERGVTGRMAALIGAVRMAE